MANAGIPVWIDFHSAIAHMKAIIIDGVTVVGRSFNYTKAADARNVEDVTFTQSHEIADRFLANWDKRRVVSRRTSESNSHPFRQEPNAAGGAALQLATDLALPSCLAPSPASARWLDA